MRTKMRLLLAVALLALTGARGVEPAAITVQGRASILRRSAWETRSRSPIWRRERRRRGGFSGARRWMASRPKECRSVSSTMCSSVMNGTVRFVAGPHSHTLLFVANRAGNVIIPAARTEGPEPDGAVIKTRAMTLHIAR